MWETSKKIISLSDADIYPEELIWGKAKNLAYLMRENYRTKNGIVLTCEVFQDFLTQNSIDVQGIGESELQILQDTIMCGKINSDILEKIFQNIPKDKKFAVRSSAIWEDSENNSWAWQLHSTLNVEKTQLEYAIKQTWASYYAKGVFGYRKHLWLSEKGIAVVLQEMCHSEISGVAFSINPLNYKQEIIVEAIKGYVEDLVWWKVTPSRWVYDPKSDKILDFSQWSNPVDASFLQDLIWQVKDIEARYGKPCDIEWAIDWWTIFFLQVRPIHVKKKDTQKKLTTLIKNNSSLSDWFTNVWHKDAEVFREEDNWKRKRLWELNEHINFPYDAPTSFPLADVVEQTDAFTDFYKEHKHEYCALRLIPMQDSGEKLRKRWLTIEEVLKTWLPDQDIDPHKYQADFIQHPQTSIFSSTFVVWEKGISWEIVSWGHHQLSHGVVEDWNSIEEFYYDFETLNLSNDTEYVRDWIEEILSFLKIENQDIQKQIMYRFDTEFFKGYLWGYFEVGKSDDFGVCFIDWNRILWKMYKDFSLDYLSKRRADLRQIIARWAVACSAGEIQGQICKIEESEIWIKTVGSEQILLCPMTSPEYILDIQKAKWIITQEWGILCHAAIICRELRKPCIVGIWDAYNRLEENQHIRCDTETGYIYTL